MKSGTKLGYYETSTLLGKGGKGEVSRENYKRTSEKLFASVGIQPQSIFVATNGPVKNVHYYAIGKGKPRVLIHGEGFTLRTGIRSSNLCRRNFNSLFLTDLQTHSNIAVWIYQVTE